jgi:hypothetical protein
MRRRPLPRAGFAAFQIELIAERAAADAHLPGQDVDPILVAILGEIALVLTRGYRVKARPSTLPPGAGRDLTVIGLTGRVGALSCALAGNHAPWRVSRPRCGRPPLAASQPAPDHVATDTGSIEENPPVRRSATIAALGCRTRSCP